MRREYSKQRVHAIRRDCTEKTVENTLRGHSDKIDLKNGKYAGWA